MTGHVDIDIHYFDEDIKFNDTLVIVCHPTIGRISTIVANYLIDHLDLNLVGALISPDFHPASIIHKGKPLPPVRIYAGEYLDDPNTDYDQLVVITSDLPFEKNVFPPIADKILEWSNQNNYRSILTIEGINKQEMDIGGSAKVFHVGSTEKAVARFEELESESKQMQNGMVSGLSGLLLYKGNIEDMSVLSLLGEAHKQFPDSRSAAAILEVMNKLVPNIEMDPEPLIEQAEKIESQIQQALSQIQQDKVSGATRDKSRGMFA